MNPFELSGPHFLQLYVLVLFLAATAALVLRWMLRLPEGEPHALDLAPYEVAYLQGGEAAAVDAAIVRLVHLEVLFVDASTGRITRCEKKLPPDAHGLEKMVYSAIDAEVGSRADSIRSKAFSTATRLRAKLDELGLLVPERRINLVHFMPACVLFATTLFGLIKVFVGLSRNRPVSYLVLLVLLSVALAALFIVLKPFRSRRGDAALARLKHENSALEYANWKKRQLTDADLVLALGLFGMGVLAGGPLSRLPDALAFKPKPPHTASGSSCSSFWSCGSGGSSCGGGGGGGGCGGGGCGGCGGG